MNILVTGGAGFIGSNIVDSYLDLGHKVVVIDDLSTGRRHNVNPNAVFIQMDIRDDDIEWVFQQHRIEFVNHQAARGDVRASLARPEEYADVNIRGGIKLLECCRKYGVKGFIYSSTGGCVYGEPLHVPTDEKHPMQPRDPYGASKACFEIYLATYKEMYGIPFTILRYPNVYGPRQNPFGEAGGVSIFAKMMLLDQDVVINGTGNQERDFVFVADVVKANLLVSEHSYNTEFNLGTGVGVNVNTIYRELKMIAGYKRDAIYGLLKAGEVRRSILTSTKIFNLCGWKPEISLQEGLRKTVDHIKRYEV